MKVRVDLEVVSDDKGNLKAMVSDLRQVGDEAKKTKSALGDFASKLTSGLGIGAGLSLGAKAAETLIGVVRSIPAEFDRMVEKGSRIADLSQRFETTAKGLQDLEYAGSLVGVSLDQTTGAITKMQRALVDTPEKFAKMGESAGELIAMDPAQAFNEIAKEVGAIPNPTERAAEAMQLFGRSGAALLPLISNMSAARAEAELLHTAISEEQVAALDSMGDAETRAAATTESLMARITASTVEFLHLDDAVNGYAVTVGQVNDATDGASKGFLAASEGVGGYLARLVALGPGIGLVVNTLRLQSDALYEVAAAAKAADAAYSSKIFKPDLKLPGPQGASALELLNDQLRESQTETDKLTRAHEKAAEAAKKQADADEALQGRLEALQAGMNVLSSGPGYMQPGMPDDNVKLGALSGNTDPNAFSAEFFEKQRKAAAEHNKQIQEAAKATFDWQHALQGVALLAGTLGGKFGDALTVVGNISKQFEGWGKMKGLDKFNAIASGVGQVGGLVGGKAGGFLSGAAGGAMTGAALGSIIPGFGTVAGGVIGGVIGGIAGLLKNNKAKKAMADVGKDWGVTISENLGKSIADTAKSLNVSQDVAESLHLNEIVGESGKSMHEFSAQIFDLMNGITNGTVPAAEGLEQVGQAFGTVVDEAAKAGTVGDALTVAMLKTAQATGQMTDEMRDFVHAQNQGMAGGAEKIMSGMKDMQLNGNDLGYFVGFGENAALFFAKGFAASVAEDGLMGALDKFGKGAQDMYKKFKDEGSQAGMAMVGPIADLQKKIGDNKSMKGMLTTLEGMGDVFKGAANQGMLDPQMQAAFGESMANAKDALISAGVDGKTAFMAIMPELKSAVDAAQQMGVPLDAKTQELKSAAEGMGFSFPVDPMIQMVDLMKTLVTGMGFELPASAQTAAAAIGGIGTAAQQSAAATTGATATMVGALDGAAAQSGTLAGQVITNFGEIGPGVVAALSGASDGVNTAVDGMVQTADVKTQQLQGMFAALSHTSIVIPFSYQQSGEGPQNMPPGSNGGGPPGSDHQGKPGSYAIGLAAGPVTTTGMAMLHGTPSNPEHVFTHQQFMAASAALSRSSMPQAPVSGGHTIVVTVNAQGASSGDASRIKNMVAAGVKQGIEEADPKIVGPMRRFVHAQIKPSARQ